MDRLLVLVLVVVELGTLVDDNVAWWLAELVLRPHGSVVVDVVGGRCCWPCTTRRSVTSESSSS